MEVAQHPVQVIVKVLNGFEIGVSKCELNKSVVYKVFGQFPIVVSKSQRPAEQAVIALDE